MQDMSPILTFKSNYSTTTKPVTNWWCYKYSSIGRDNVHYLQTCTQNCKDSN